MTKRHPSIKPAHPGDILREDVLPATGMTKSDLAGALGITVPELESILSGDQAVTPTIARRLEATVGSSVEFWLHFGR